MQSDLHELIEIAKSLGLTSIVWGNERGGKPIVTVAAWPDMVSAETEMEALVKLIDKKKNLRIKATTT